jgi:propanol-preferring alcohol dehydrogenase
MGGESMLAAVLASSGPVNAGSLSLERRPRPQARAGEVLVEVEACAVCRTDLHIVAGELPARRAPLVPGHQAVGVVAACGAGVERALVGRRVGVAWLHRTCGRCRFCARGDENLCTTAEFTGWSVDGGFAQWIRAPADFVHPLPDDLDAVRTAPLLCAGIIGFRCLRASGLDGRWSGAVLGLYGFGAAGHIAIQIARARGAEVFVCTRDARHRELARELGAAWVGGTTDAPPRPLDAAIVFAPAGEIVPAALRALDPGATLVLGGIHMSPIPRLDYELLYRERCIRSVTNNTRADGREFLAEALRSGVTTHVQSYPLRDVDRALQALAGDGVRGAAVLVCREP